MKKYILILCTALCAISCKSFLEEYNPVGIKSAGDDKDLLETSINGVLRGMCDVFTGAGAEMFGIPSGIIHWGRTNGRLDVNQYLAMLHFTHYAESSDNAGYLNKLYIGITRANTLIASLPESPVEDAYKKEIEAEARFYRAVLYFTAVRIWGDLPLRLEPVNSSTAVNFPRAPYYEVYKQIIRDLEYAEQNMRTPARVKEVTPGQARPSRFAATAYLSSVYVTLGSLLASPDDNFWNNTIPERCPDFSAIGLDKEDLAHAAEQAYEKALAYAEQLIPGSATHKDGCEYRLLEKYQDLFTYDHSWTRDGYNAFLHPEQVLTLSITPTSCNYPFYAAYGMPEFPSGTSLTPEIESRQWGRYRPTRWVFQKWCETYPGTYNSDGGYYMSSGDPRLDISVFHTSMDEYTGGRLEIYPAFIKYTAASAYPYFKKFISKAYATSANEADIHLLRFAEVYLNAAEAAAYLDKTSLAYKYIEEIHKRARHSVPDGNADSESPKMTDGLSGQALLDRIFWERVFETWGEGQDFANTHRHGAHWMAENIAKAKNEFLSRPESAALFGKYYPVDFRYSEDWTEVRKGLLAAFPENEMLYNAGIGPAQQNDFYVSQK